MSVFGVSIDPRNIDVAHVPDGMIDGTDAESEMKGAGVTDFPDSLRYDKAIWDDVMREAERTQSAPEHYSMRFTHQGNSHCCVYHARTQLFEICYARQLGKQWGIWTSPLFGYRENKGPNGQWGGANVSEAFRRGMSVGFLPEFDGPDWLGGKNGQYAKFLHTMAQTAGRSEEHWPQKGWPRSLPEGYEQTAKHFRILGGYWIRDEVDHFSATMRFGMSNGRNGHSIPHVNIVKSDSGAYLSKYKDSYNRFLYDSMRLWNSGGYCICAVTMPDDPSRPAGTDMKQPA